MTTNPDSFAGHTAGEMSDEALERAAKVIWDSERHRMMEAAGYATDWESQPRSVKRGVVRKARLAVEAAAPTLLARVEELEAENKKFRGYFQLDDGLDVRDETISKLTDALAREDAEVVIFKSALMALTEWKPQTPLTASADLANLLNEVKDFANRTLEQAKALASQEKGE